MVSYWCLTVTYGLSRSLKVKYYGTTELPTYGFLLMFDNTYGRTRSYGSLWDIRLQNLSDIEFDLSGSPNVNGWGALNSPIYDFLLMYNSNHAHAYSSSFSGYRAWKSVSSPVNAPHVSPTLNPGIFFFYQNRIP